MSEKLVGIAELKNKLSEYLRSVRKGRSIVVVDRQTPIAEIRPYVKERPVRAALRPARELRSLKLPSRPKRATNSVESLREDRDDR